MIADNYSTKENIVNSSRTRYKIELCRNWVNGFCEFGNKCTYAHGGTELKRSPSPLLVEKVVVCELFKQRGYCLNGSQCQFIHKLGKNEMPFKLENPNKGNSLFIDLEDVSYIS